MIIFWRRVDVPGLECARIDADGDTVRALSTILCEEAGGFRCDYDWQMNSDWSTRRLTVTREGTNGRQSRVMERSDGAWIVDGAHRPDLDGAEEPDLPSPRSATPSRSVACRRRSARRSPSILSISRAGLSRSSDRGSDTFAWRRTSSATSIWALTMGSRPSYSSTRTSSFAAMRAYSNAFRPRAETSSHRRAGRYRPISASRRSPAEFPKYRRRA